MAFGRRAATAPAAVSPRGRRGGRWLAYPAAILAVAVSAWLIMIAMSFVPAFNASRTPVEIIAGPALLAALNIAIVSAVMMAVVDLVLSLVRFRRPWLYSGAVACMAYAFCLWIGSVGGGAPSPILYIGMALIPAGIGGAVLGHFRRDQA
ncbi:MAG: hypothetical protein KL785_02240 [Brevundimonas sp.]|nr:hypothetical protein [Brevundimonas sp.]